MTGACSVFVTDSAPARGRSMASNKSKQPNGVKSPRAATSVTRRRAPAKLKSTPKVQRTSKPADVKHASSLPGLQAVASTGHPTPIAAEGLFGMQQEYMQRLGSLWSNFFGSSEKPEEPIADPRFADPAWQGNPLAAFYARAYLLNSEFMTRMADSVKLDPHAQRRLRFAVSQCVDAASPSNYLATNPARAATTAGIGRCEPARRHRESPR